MSLPIHLDSQCRGIAIRFRILAKLPKGLTASRSSSGYKKIAGKRRNNTRRSIQGKSKVHLWMKYIKCSFENLVRLKEGEQSGERLIRTGRGRTGFSLATI